MRSLSFRFGVPYVLNGGHGFQIRKVATDSLHRQLQAANMKLSFSLLLNWGRCLFILINCYKLSHRVFYLNLFFGGGGNT
jgi:hypothetical protein